MQGDFSSSTPATPAVTATGTGGTAAISATSDAPTAVEVVNDRDTALLGGTTNGVGVVGNCLGNGIGVLARSQQGTAVNATSDTGIAVLAQSSSAAAVQGTCLGDDFGVVGIAPNAGVAAFNPNNDHAAYLASDCCAAWFTGPVSVMGNLFKSSGGFRIDHPLAPAEKYLTHSFVESSEMKNVYDGTVTAGADGTASVELPGWFEALNRDFRYQLTAIGAPAPDLHIAEEIEHRRFRIAGAPAGLKVAWQVTGVRADAWAEAHRIEPEQTKPRAERGRYLHPALYGAPPEKALRPGG
ncbi:hypothetical protein [Kitasatospora sp. CB01950]|uniref:hypothetical protein n=1 Tax=Kitasatospora sp. CB01950 TaxID=1703930 RepID=UPI00093B6112|nr:hypothetical protein [Kitasatospora sp. CB01950]OKJ09173.1 hypothetical protein AMK19_17450 [Kitasatospora sp. CB01950]